MLTFGMPTLIETNTLEECVDLCKQLNLSFLELNMNLPAYQLHRMDPHSYAANRRTGRCFLYHPFR